MYRYSNFLTTVNEPFSQLSINFLDELSKEIRKEFKNNLTKEILYLIFWLSKKNILKKKKNFSNDIGYRLGRGKTIHYSAQNISTNFIFSFAFGLLSGNSNIVFFPDKIKESKILSNITMKLIKKKKFKKLNNSNFFIKNTNRNKANYICKNPNSRVIWGSDNKIKQIKSNNLVDNRCFDLIFGDRYSISLLSINKNLKIHHLSELVKNFYNDNFLFNQNACSSSHLIYWVNTEEKLIKIFWEKLFAYAKKFNQIEIDQNLRRLYKINSYMIHNKFKYINQYNPYFFIFGLGAKFDAENLRGENGIFFEKKILNLDEINKKNITTKLQTLSFYGLSRSHILKWIRKKNLLGIDRVVSIGKSLEIDFHWDGFDLMKSLTRIIG